MGEFNLSLQNFKLGKNGKNFDFSKIQAGITENSKNSTFFKKFDLNNNGVLEKGELEALQKSVEPFAKDGVVTNREAKKLLKSYGLNDAKAAEFFEFLQNAGTSAEEVQDCFYSLFGDREAVNIKYKPDEQGFVRTSSRDVQSGAVIQENYNNGIESRTVYYDGDNVSYEEIVRGTKTIVKDSSGRVLKETVDKGNGLSEVTEYEYDGDGTEPVNVTVKKMSGGEEIQEPPVEETHVEDAQVENGNKTVFDNGRTLIKTEDGAILQDEGGEPVNIKYDKEGNILSTAKEGETFTQTAERLGIKKDTPEFEKFKELNAEAAKKGWFRLGVDVKIPAGMEEKINLEGLNVDSKAEIAKFNRKTVENADISKYTEENTETKVLDKSTSWWALAKETLSAEGKEKLTNAEISTRMNELMKLNEGKQPAKGTEVILPKSSSKTETVEIVEETSNATETQNNNDSTTPAQKYSASNLEKNYPKDRFDIITDENRVFVKDKASGNKVLEVYADSSSAYVTKYNDQGQKIEYVVENDQGDVVYRCQIDPDSGEDISSETFDNNGQRTESRKFYKDESTGYYEAEVTEYIGGKPFKIYDTAGNKPDRYPLAEDLRDDIYAKTALGLPTTGKDIRKHILEINAENVIAIMEAYQKINKDGESLVSAIIAECGLPKDERIEYLAHIKQALIDNAIASGKYTDDIAKDFDKEVKYQMEKVGFADGEYLDSYMNKLNTRTAVNEIDSTNLPNGEIDGDFKQGQTGDCWLLAGIKAVAETPKGLKILNESLKVDENGNVTVTLKGVGKSYVITKEELAGNNQFSSGDADVRAIEIAMDRYFQEERGVRNSIDLNGNMAYVAFELLTGKGGRGFLSDSYGRIPEYWFSDSQIDNFNKPNHVAVVSAGSKGDISYQTTNGETQTLLDNHAYTVKGSDDKNVYLINPHDTSKIIAVPRDTFKDFFDQIDEFDL